VLGDTVHLEMTGLGVSWIKEYPWINIEEDAAATGLELADIRVEPTVENSFVSKIVEVNHLGQYNCI